MRPMDREAQAQAPLVAAVAPDGRVYVERRADAPALDPAADARIDAAFARGGGAGLLHLGAAEVGTPTDELASLARGVPPITGAEYVTPAVLERLWREVDAALRAALADS